MLDQIGHHLADRPEAIEQIENEADRRLRLFVGIERCFARGAALAPVGVGLPSSPRPALALRPASIRAFRICNSASDIVPLKPSSRRSL